MTSPSNPDAPVGTEHHLRALGLPLVLEPSVRWRSVLPRSAGLTWALAVGLWGLAAFDRANDLATELFENETEEYVPELELSDPMVYLVLMGLGLFLAAPLLGWLIGRLACRRRVIGTVLGGLGAVMMVALPTVAFDLRDGLPPWALVVVLTVVLVATYFGAGTLVRWSARRVGRELWTMGPMTARVLPVLMLAILFFFYNAEIWQVMVAINWARTWAVVAVMAGLTIFLVVMTARDEVNRILAEHEADGTRAVGAPPLRRAERFNLLVLPVIASLIQITLFAGLVYVFLVFFGWLSISDATVQTWTSKPSGRLNGLLSLLPISVTLAKVATTLAAFSALNVAATSSSDASHRARFVEPLLEDVVHGLAARDAYVAGRAPRRGSARAAGPEGERPGGVGSGVACAGEPGGGDAGGGESVVVTDGVPVAESGGEDEPVVPTPKRRATEPTSTRQPAATEPTPRPDQTSGDQATPEA